MAPRALAAVLALSAVTTAAQHVNLAPAGTATQSSTGSGGVPERAIDKDTDGAYWNLSVSHTIDEPNSWHEVDLGGTFDVHEVRVHNRSDCCEVRLSNFRVSVFAGATEVFGQDLYAGSGHVPKGQMEAVLLPPGVAGDRVRVQLNGLNNDGTGVLSLAELEVLQYGPLPTVNLAPLGTASQSSLGSGGVPERAIDGNDDGWWGNGSVSHTDNVPGSWWELDLGAVHAIDEIVLHNRSDCCAHRLGNFRVSVFDGATEVHGSNHFSSLDTVGVFPPFAIGHVGAGEAYPVPLPPGTAGDRVRVELLGVNEQGDSIVSLAEVEVLRHRAYLATDVDQISYNLGGSQTLSLEAGLGAAGLPYLVMGSLAGTSPGQPLDNGDVLPLNADGYWFHTLFQPNAPPLAGSFGFLDALGRGQATLTIPAGSASVAGLTAHHAFVALQPPLAPLVKVASDAAPVVFVP